MGSCSVFYKPLERFLKTWWEKQRLVSSTVFFSHNVFCSYKNFRFISLSSRAVSLGSLINPLRNDKILDVTKLKAYADDKLNIARMMVSLLHKVENTVGKGENAG